MNSNSELGMSANADLTSNSSSNNNSKKIFWYQIHILTLRTKSQHDSYLWYNPVKEFSNFLHSGTPKTVK